MPGAQWDSCGFYGEEISEISETVRTCIGGHRARKKPLCAGLFQWTRGITKQVGQGASRPPAVPLSCRLRFTEA